MADKTLVYPILSVEIPNAGASPVRARKLILAAGANVTLGESTTGDSCTVTVAAAGGGGTPATSVTSETTYGIASAVGTSTNYARQDHTHGSPAAPTAASVGAVPTTRLVSTTAPLTGGGDLSADRTLVLAKSTAAVDGYLAAADFTTFNAKVATTRTISTTAPLSGGGDLSANRTLAIAQSSGAADGYLSSADWTTFNGKQSSGLALLIANNLSDLNNAATARTNLGLGTLATQSGTFSGTSSGTNTGDQTITLTGDVTGSGTGSFAATIAAQAVTVAKATFAATQRLFGRNTAGAGVAEEVTVLQVLNWLFSAQGDLIYRGAANPTVLAAGTAGQRLTTGGSAANPSWADDANVYSSGKDGVLAWDGVSTVFGLAPAGGVYSLTGDVYMAGGSMISANTRIATGGYRLYCSGLITFTDATSIISCDGTAGSGSTGGAALAAQGPIFCVGQAGGAGRTGSTGSGTAGTASATSAGGGGGAGGAPSSGGSGGGGGAITAPTANQGGVTHLGHILWYPRVQNGNTMSSVNGGAGGGGGGANVGTGTASGGGGGGGGGSVHCFFRYVAGAGVLRSLGGAGGNAAATGNGNAGGGGGGGGGMVYLVTSTPSPACTLSAAGGAFGNLAGAGSANGVAGSAGLTLTITV